MKKNDILPPLKPSRDKFFQVWYPNISSITGEACEQYLEKLQWLSENPRAQFRIDNGYGEKDINHWYRPTNKVRIENGENPDND